MRQEDFERALLRLWTTTRIPLTRANVLAVIEVPRAKLDGWMSSLVRDGIVELDSDEEGEVLWRVRGAERAKSGPRSAAELLTFERLSREVDDVRPERRPTRVEARLVDRPEPQASDEKSLVASGVLSFVFGPFGWLYAAPLKESIPAIAAMTVLAAVLPSALFFPLFSASLPLFAVAGVGYAHAYNRSGRRTALLERLAQRALPPGGSRR